MKDLVAEVFLEAHFEGEFSSENFISYDPKGPHVC